MSGPPHWLAYAWAASLWVAAGCVGMAVVAAVVDWVTATLGPGTDSLPPLPASAGFGDQIPDGPANRPSGPP